jgi:hypothetical protein
LHANPACLCAVWMRGLHVWLVCLRYGLQCVDNWLASPSGLPLGTVDLVYFNFGMHDYVTQCEPGQVALALCVFFVPPTPPAPWLLWCLCLLLPTL